MSKRNSPLMGNIWGVDADPSKPLFPLTKHYERRDIEAKDKKEYQKNYWRTVRSKNAPDPPRRNRNTLWGSDAGKKPFWPMYSEKNGEE